MAGDKVAMYYASANRDENRFNNPHRFIIDNFMIKVTFIDHQNQASEVQADTGISLMRAAVENGIPGIVAECGGACSCATCVCYVDDAWASKIGPATDMEHDMIESVLEERPTGRLSCQITLRPDMDGLVVHVPESQY